MTFGWKVVIEKWKSDWQMQIDRKHFGKDRDDSKMGR